METLVEEHKTRQYWARLERTPDGTWHVLDGDSIGCHQWQWNLSLRTSDEAAARREYRRLVDRADEYARDSRRRVPLFQALMECPWRRRT